ncbi:TetR family transcriptional regulator [Levilactobacillus bambusae]|uniref:HTH tetR-type domain-containing protein n=1 Tax=Levilactobacillus bambusae TaxID=2024736 RepID=A0A2V1N1I6_9LACO|nr:TetR family transcriptional regulator [Levilactobacillus bambusae]PWG00236.1 hypothetical protein DCM90_04690 [Levilactobacillus bambusae]
MKNGKLDQILEGFRQIVQKETFDKISVVEIARVANVHRKTVYYYFTDKYDILRTVYTLGALRHVDPANLTLDNFTTQLDRLLNELKDNLVLYQHTVTYDDGLWDDLSSRYFSEGLARLRKEQDTLAADPDIAHYESYLYAGALNKMIIEWLQADGDVPPEKLILAFQHVAGYPLFDKNGLPLY